MTEDEVPKALPGGTAYFVEYDEDLWKAYSDDDKAYCKSVWIKHAEPTGAPFVALRLLPDPLFPSSARETPYIEWQHMFERTPEQPFTVQLIARIDLNVPPGPKVREHVEAELRRLMPERKPGLRPRYSAWHNGREVFKGQV